MKSPGEDEVFIPTEIMDKFGSKYTISSDFEYVIFTNDKSTKEVYSYSFSASFSIYNIKNKTRRYFRPIADVSEYQHVGFGPIGSQIVFISNGDVYYLPSASDSAEYVRLTTTGQYNNVTNGITDWFYEEQIFKTNIAYWWSPDGKFLAFGQFDDTLVKKSFITTYFETTASNPYPYPKQDFYGYPKAGGVNPSVTVHVANLQTNDVLEFQRPLKMSYSNDRLNILHSVQWQLDNENILLTWSNRNFTVMVKQICNTKQSPTCTDDVLPPSRRGNGNLAQKTEITSWLPHLRLKHLSTKENLFFAIMPDEEYNIQKGRFNHLAMINFTSKPSKKRYLTGGQWEVTKLLHYDSKNNFIYYVSNEQGHGSRHVFRINVKTKDKFCVTCDSSIYLINEDRSGYPENLTGNVDDRCLYHDATFGSSSEWMILHCKGPKLPYSFYLTTNNFSANLLEDWRNMTQPGGDNCTRHTIQVPASSNLDGYKLNFQMIMKGSVVSKRPVVVQIGDAGTETADFRFKMDFGKYLMSHERVIYVYLDGRGSGYSGENMEKAIYKNPGYNEIQDIEEIVRYIEENLDITVPSVGIVGKGYGGFVAIYGVTDDSFDERIKCAVATAPIADWRLYTSVGAEKILGDPEENLIEYSSSNLINRVSYLQNNKSVLIHQGMRDRIVHPQHTILLQEKAMEEWVPSENLQTVMYASEGHSNWSKRSVEEHMERSRKFLTDCLMGGG